MNTLYSFSDDSFTKPVPGTHRLGIHITESHMAVMVIQNEHNKICGFQLLEHNPPVQLSESYKIKELFENVIDRHEWLSVPDIKITVLVPGNFITFLPEEYFDSYKKEQLIEPQYFIQPSDVLFSEKLSTNPCIALFALPWNWNQHLKSRYSDVKLLQEDVCWAEAVISAKQKHLSGTSVILYLDKGTVKILIAKNANILFFNTFKYFEPVDVLYYLQLVADQTGLDATSVKLYLAGPCHDNPEIEKLLSQYSYDTGEIKLPFLDSIPSTIRKKYAQAHLALFSVLICG
jgi:hypothetical protein